MPTNLYGPGDNFSLQNSHVLPALLRKIHDAKEHGTETVEVWGTGKPRRDRVALRACPVTPSAVADGRALAGHSGHG